MTKLSQLKIDPEFQNQINPPSFEETHQLEMNILKEERVLNPVITWNGYIVDGHAGHQPALCLQPVQQHHRIPCSAGRRKHPCTEGQFRCVAQPGSLIRRQQYGIYYKTRQHLQRPLHLRR